MFATVSFGGATQPALLVPSEALIRTGKRTLVMLALDKGRYRPAEVQIGRESGDDTEILAGLSEGEKVVASGQFLID
ncbi:efflux RND transporter periplasmic adaptor subunit, partial [Escherichia coli]